MPPTPASPRRPLKLMLIANDPAIAGAADRSGVDRIFIDLEKLGKRERQGHLDTVISDHRVADIDPVRAALTTAELLVRVDPWHDRSPAQVDTVIAAGAQVVMLPMFRAGDEVRRFVGAVAGRATVNLLLETAEAMLGCEHWLGIDGIDEVMVGLNDLHMALGRDFMFELLTDGTVERIGREVHRHRRRFGFGGIARVGEGQLPAELIIREHKRLDSQIVILSRTFHRNARSLAELESHTDLAFEIGKIRQAEVDAEHRSAEEIELDRLKVVDIVQRVAAFQRKRASGRP